MKFSPHSPAEVEEMLASIGLKNRAELFADISDKLKLGRDLELGPGLAEMELGRHLKELAGKNMNLEDYPCFLGAGAYDHYIPAALDQLLLRSEFYTAYTPYQPEISQGILQAIFEYQTMICALTGMDVANASLYDGASALAEACQMACEGSRRRKVILPATLHPEYLEVVKSYAISGKMEIIMAPEREGIIDKEATLALLKQDSACLVIQQPNFFGCIEEIAVWEKSVHAAKALLIMVVNPISLGLLKSPGEWGADIVVGEGQPLGNPLSFGGPYLGFMACSKKYMRKMPGRLVGQSVDSNGETCYVLTLQAREQHIRREQASSNICSNQALNALAASIYLSLVGRQGLVDIATRCHQLAVYARRKMESYGLPLKYPRVFFNEFAVEVDDPARINQLLLEQGIIGGYELPGALLLAFTEKRTRAEIDRLAALIGGECR
ncbi:MAG: aminomethyl-transferring glycine dehydrogenase subunit GcvPA [Syntrophomonas sp.]|uniref:aminomethyl-transferring glycine dehydrogenase subunit GcvPA n=1 Tax=Syntrophomonas sp. TaxID=2053627 RepID=UPI002608546C|nr:aminomethyl-transferring glycine dehydrogenase subunit GcvPA [Syntrophomonas sp.]MDD2511227.1 aminomethyl-transferring glycine dehydrogenase subunit GcvPA [Syntrophomonas sp.]MDD3074397.1 aminomethyl-transferring glycine dehydrogenase subunit GcvPA [Eubacteriales bacterium]MDD3878934.1 aminomethyl-transferring glycine dehydrogenase subunit GcvPA [Syntrophomonas sp.]MDD4626618.1 aminomethyl-transferring glycine dehydrogenase subunit GcvPA [Syntrophomonas sp.]